MLSFIILVAGEIYVFLLLFGLVMCRAFELLDGRKRNTECTSHNMIEIVATSIDVYHTMYC
jgi:hypothetical protein